MLLVRSEDDYKNKSYIESALHFSHTRGGIGRRIGNALQEVVHCVRILGVRHKGKWNRA
ncbi:hypothetical protein J0N61_01580 [Listeria monocytogenes]|uniref:hypothetical protein n=1 Tax=Listeria monocytogenes TaxID=1639 RepID=UPI0015A3ACAD|nr:hypothetical protein [Listeria monocytogenes]WNV46916.1 hypothetical protein LPLmcIH18_0065 [Listeria phage LP-LmcIH1-8]WNV46981.1 hypothetical protein LPLmcIH19_0064 [Listeria phage LP-LmcIH1-9]EHU3555088.1 hypothetical protein [Listeria monocytogenes]EHU3610550.1 hypothetical protein [Listeria monocytogenes]EHU3627464.1 hypothetical protein [Listeria monocytogenes]